MNKIIRTVTHPLELSDGSHADLALNMYYEYDSSYTFRDGGERPEPSGFSIAGQLRYNNNSTREYLLTRYPEAGVKPPPAHVITQADAWAGSFALTSPAPVELLAFSLAIMQQVFVDDYDKHITGAKVRRLCDFARSVSAVAACGNMATGDLAARQLVTAMLRAWGRHDPDKTLSFWQVTPSPHAKCTIIAEIPDAGGPYLGPGLKIAFGVNLFGGRCVDLMIYTTTLHALIPIRSPQDPAKMTSLVHELLLQLKIDGHGMQDALDGLLHEQVRLGEI